ncbi:hypothetical protein [Bradyrhizobium sp. USDA 4508]
MPEHIMPIGDSWKQWRTMDSFTQGYVHAIFFTECHSDNPELKDCTLDDVSPEMMQAIEADCRDFQEANVELLERVNGVTGRYERSPYDDERAGTDFWFTRNGHGAGFWDRGLGADGDRLSDMAKAYGCSDLYLGDDGKLYLS